MFAELITNLSTKVNDQGSRVRIHSHPERAQPLPTHSRKIPGGILSIRTVRPVKTLSGAGECQGPDVALIIHFY